MKKSNNRLPPEFLHQISAYLSFQDCYNCLHVNRFWYHAFQRVLYRVINIYSDTQFKKLIDSLCFSKSLKEEYHNGHLIKALYLHNSIQYNETVDFLEDLDDPYYVKHINITQKQLVLLNDLCPQLEIFEFDRSQWKHLQLTAEMKQWKYIIRCSPIQHSTFLYSPFTSIFGSCLTYLNINYCYSSQQEDELTSFLYLIPTIEHLVVEILFKNTQSRLNISKLLQNIHTALPKLHTLEFIRTNPSRHEPPASVYDSNILSNFAEKPNLKSLTIQGHIDSIKWFEFIQNNYPHLQDLSINQLATSRFGTKWMWQQALVNLIRSLRFMKSLTIGGRNAPQLLSKGLALELKAPTCPVENLYIDFKTYQAIESCQFLLIIAAFGLRQLRFLRLRVWEQTPGWSGVTLNLFQCRQLVSLELSLSKGLMDQYPFTPFLMDHFLENMPQLQELSLVGAEIQVLHTNFSTFSLCSLSLVQSRVQNHQLVFSYLSLCCPRLKQMGFRRCEVTKAKLNVPISIPTYTNNYCVFDMPYSRFEKFYLSSFLIYTGLAETIEYVAIKLLHVDPDEYSLASRHISKVASEDTKESKVAWCHISGLSHSFAYPQYSVVQDDGQLDELNSLYSLYTTEVMPGNYVPSIGVITIRCKSVSDIYLDNVKIPRKSFKQTIQ
ncbi:hypothetical protein G6F37_000031 [Rhizopus arrhizus]|nr:hypothetical protein G6F38_006662 [Rhizopus arrhizus]KAG1164690.1 hypothetical protein G6F37_000031 [Rhizopus arrhizus]